MQAPLDTHEQAVEGGKWGVRCQRGHGGLAQVQQEEEQALDDPGAMIEQGDGPAGRAHLHRVAVWWWWCGGEYLFPGCPCLLTLP